MNTSRRTFLRRAGTLIVAAPVVITTPGLLMPVKKPMIPMEIGRLDTFRFIGNSKLYPWQEDIVDAMACGKVALMRGRKMGKTSTAMMMEDYYRKISRPHAIDPRLKDHIERIRRQRHA